MARGPGTSASILITHSLPYGWQLRLVCSCTRCIRKIPYRDDGAAARVTVISRTNVGLSAALVFGWGRLGNR